MVISEYIGLGSNCSVTWQLNKYNLRTKSYPFDWVKISLGQIINILENNFEDYIETIEFKKNSFKHENYDNQNNSLNSNSLLLKNKYGVEFAHELISEEQIEEFKSKILTRINRFRNLINMNVKIDFIRIELKPIKLQWITQINKLVELLKTYITNFKLILIINIDNNVNLDDLANEHIQIFTFDNFSSDWKMDIIDWVNILK